MARKRGNSWTASGYDPAVRRKRHLGTFPSKKEAVEAEAEWKLRTKGTSRETCDQFASRWPDDYPRPRESTNIHNRERVQVFAVDFKGLRLADLSKPKAREWALKHKHNVPAVRAMFTDAVNDGLCPTNPFSNLRLPGSRGRKDIIALTEEELHSLTDLALDPKCEFGDFAVEYRAMILFSGYVGLRPGELFALRPEDIDGQSCEIRRALSSKTGKIGPTKTGETWTAIIPPKAQDALLEVPRHPNGLLFCSPRERMWTQSSHYYYWKTLRKEAGRPGMDFYELRHCAATMMLERGVSHADVAVQFGHRDGGKLIMERYGHPAQAGARARMLAAYDAVEGPKGIAAKRRELAS